MEIVDLTDDHMLFVAACTHIDDLDIEKDQARRVRESWLRNTRRREPFLLMESINVGDMKLQMMN
jgi:hypothetical protein